MQRSFRLTGLLAVALILAPAPQAELVEEIVALIDGDILTKSEYDQEEQAMVQEIYRRYAGAELDRAVEAVRRTLMMDLIDRKILVGRAGRMFDTDRMGDVFVDMFRDQQQVKDDAEFQAALESMGMTLESLRSRLVDNFAPDEVVRYEVSSRISVADAEVDAYYAEHPDEFRHEDQVKLREIVLLADTEAKRAERRAEIDEIYARLTAETFGQIASEVSEAGTKDDSGLLGTIKRGDLSSTLEDVAFGLQQGHWSDVLENAYGFHILFAEEVQVGASMTLEEVRPSVRAKLEDETFAAKLTEFMVKARSESDWCVKELYAASLSDLPTDKVCKEM